MSLIQNQDVKSLAELVALGASGPDLINDVDIWVTANGINKTLKQVIIDGDIGAETGASASYKNRAICFGDNSTEDMNIREKFIDGEGNSVFKLDFAFKLEDEFQIYCNGKRFVEYISETVTPDFWFKKSEPNVIVLCDSRTGAYPIIIEQTKPVDLAPVLNSLYACMNLKFEAFATTDGSTFLYNVSGVSLENGKTFIKTNQKITPTDHVFVTIDGKFIPKQLPNHNFSEFFIIQENGILLGGDYSAVNKKVSIIVFKESLIKEANGSITFTTTPVLHRFLVQSPNNHVWEIKAEDTGAISVEETTGSEDTITFKKNGNTVVKLSVSNFGEVSVDDSASGIFVFSGIFLKSPNGIIWELKVDLDNSFYLEQVEQTNSLKIKDAEDNQVFELSEGLIRLKHFFGEVDVTVQNESKNSVFAISSEKSGPKLLFKNEALNSFEEVRTLIDSPVGTIREAIVPSTEVINFLGENWVPMNGTILEVADYPELASVIHSRFIKDGKIYLNDHGLHREYEFMDNDTRDNQNTPHGYHTNWTHKYRPNWTQSELVAMVTCMGYIGYSGGVDGNDTTYNDFYTNETGIWADCRNSEWNGNGYWHLMALFAKDTHIIKYIKVK